MPGERRMPLPLEQEIARQIEISRTSFARPVIGDVSEGCRLIGTMLATIPQMNPPRYPMYPLSASSSPR